MLAKPLVGISLLSADHFNIQKELKRIAKSGVDLVQLDVMDGNYVPNITVGLPVLKAITGKSKIPIDVHLMISNPDFFVPKFVEFRPSMMSFHVETSKNPKKLLHLMKKKGIQAGLAVNAHVPVKKILPYLEHCNFVLVMSVRAGFGGQKLMPSSLKKVRKLVKERTKRGLHFLIEIDGGIDNKTCKKALNAGVDILVSGSYLVKHKNLPKAVNELRKI